MAFFASQSHSWCCFIRSKKHRLVRQDNQSWPLPFWFLWLFSVIANERMTVLVTSFFVFKYHTWIYHSGILKLKGIFSSSVFAFQSVVGNVVSARCEGLLWGFSASERLWKEMYLLRKSWLYSKDSGYFHKAVFELKQKENLKLFKNTR